MTASSGLYVGIRYTCDLNEWIDFTALVPRVMMDIAKEKILEAMDRFWNDVGDYAYGDLVEELLHCVILYHDSENDEDPDYERTLESIEWYSVEDMR